MTASLESAATDTFTARASWTRYGVLALLCSAAFIAYYQRTTMNVAGNPIGLDLSLASFDLGEIKSAFFLGYALFQVPSGLFRDLVGTRAALTAYALLWSLAVALVATVDGYWTLAAAWFTAGVAQAGVFPCAVAAIRQWFPSGRRAMVSGLLAACMSIGSALSNATFFYLITELDGWRLAFAAVAVPSAIWAAIFVVWFRNRPEEHRRVNEAERAIIREGAALDSAATHDVITGSVPWLRIFGSVALWGLFAQQFFRAAGYVFYQTSFVDVLQKTRNFSLEESGWLGSLPLWAVVLGSPCGGWLSDWVAVHHGRKRLGRQVFPALGLFSCGVLTTLAYWIADGLTASILVAAGMFLAAIGGTCAYAVAIEKGGRQTATVFSMMNMCGNMGATLLPYLLPRIIPVDELSKTFLLIGGIHIAAALCWSFVHPSGSIDDKR